MSSSSLSGLCAVVNFTRDLRSRWQRRSRTADALSNTLWSLSSLSCFCAGAAGGVGMCAAPAEPQSAQTTPEGPTHQDHDGHPRWGDSCSLVTATKIVFFNYFQGFSDSSVCHPVHQVPEEVFEEVLMGALQTDLESAFRTPEQLQLLLVALQRFPQTLKPKKLKKLLGSSTIINADNIPK